MKTTYLFLIGVALTTLSCGQGFAGNGTRLYAMDCGSIEVSDMSPFDESDKMKGKKELLANPCFLIKNKGKYLIWDTGHPSSLAAKPAGVSGGGFSSKLETNLSDQLSKIGLKPSDIDFLAISHLHPDHAGNANLFRDAVWLSNKKEREFMFAKEQRSNAEFFENYSDLEKAETKSFEDKIDVFGDGKAVIHSMPGHTPGHSVLLLELDQEGSILLTGDLFTHENARKLGTVPTFTWNKSELNKSRKRFETIATRKKAKVIIQHSKKDFDSLPVFPMYLE